MRLFPRRLKKLMRKLLYRKTSKRLSLGQEDLPLEGARNVDGLPVTTIGKIESIKVQGMEILRVVIPGAKKEEVKVEIEGDKNLKISWQSTEEKEKRKKKEKKGFFFGLLGFTKVEQEEEEEEETSGTPLIKGSSSFFFSCPLPDNIKADKVSASMLNGVLIVTFSDEQVREKCDVKQVQIIG